MKQSLTQDETFDSLPITPSLGELLGGDATPSSKPRLSELSWRTVVENTKTGVVMLNNQGWGANCNKPVTEYDWKELYLKWRKAILDATTISALRDYAEEHNRMPELKPTPKFTWSYSALSDFENCPLSYAHKRYYKTYPVVETEAMRHGTRVHKALELYGLGEEQPETELDLIKNYTKYIDVMKSKGGKFYAECQVALTDKLKLTQWFAPDAWARGVFDVALKNGRKLMVYDWKTGKPKEDLLQLQIFCAFAALAFPSVHEFDAKFIWLKNGTITGLPKTLRREDIKEIWSKLLPRVQRMKDAWDTEVWQAKPSGLCGWCAHGDNCKYRR